MLMSLIIDNNTVKLLSNINTGANTLVINNTIVPESSWVGTGYYTVGSIKIAKIEANTGNVHCVKVNDLNYKLVTKNVSSRIYAEDVIYDDTTVKEALDDLSDKVSGMFPIGYILLSTSSVNPGTYLGGTWTQIKDTFLLCAGDRHAAGTTGGSETNSHTHSVTTSGTVENHVLTVAEIPSHSHSIDASNVSPGAGWGNVLTGGVQQLTLPEGTINYTGGGGGHNHGFTGSNVTSGTPSNTNIMPPYKAVYAWERTA